MATVVSTNITKDKFSNFSFARKKLVLKKMGNVRVEIEELKLQKSGIAITTSAIALMIFSSFLNPFFASFSSLIGLTLFGVCFISFTRELFSGSSKDDLRGLLNKIKCLHSS
ncbi:MAG: hypothetical protein K1060chlam4_00877 [Candidatus Anoxychlamydiales bacterium]|nr:hypothetical protein [Candidatus Anoxychlamydiales bacterium]